MESDKPIQQKKKASKISTGVTGAKDKSTRKMIQMEKKKKSDFHKCSVCGEEYYGKNTTFKFFEDGVLVKQIKNVCICSCCTAKHAHTPGVFSYTF